MIRDATAAIVSIKGFLPVAQVRFFDEAFRQQTEEISYFTETLTGLQDRIEKMHSTYGQDGMGDEAIVHLHYFAGGCDWFITEKDSEATQHQAFGYADLGYGGELGYISIEQLRRTGAVELDLHFTPKTLREVKAARRA